MEIRIDDVPSRLKGVPGFSKVRFILLFGSASEGKASPGSDIDIVIYHDGLPEEAELFRYHALKALDDSRFDISIFQHLPLYIRIHAVKGKILCCRDLRFLYDIAYDTIRDYEDFRHRLQDYTGERSIS